MEQARNYVCSSCSTAVPVGAQVLRTVRRRRCRRRSSTRGRMFFGDMQNPAKAKLILIRGEGMDGLSVPPQGRAAHRRPQRAARVPGRSVRLAEARQLLLPRRQARRARRGLAQRRVPARARHASTSQPGDHLPRGRAALPPRRRRRARPTARTPTARTSTRRPSTRARSASRRSCRAALPGMTVCARGNAPADRARGRRPELPGRPLHVRLALPHRGARRQVHAHRPEQPQRHLRAPEERARARATATTSSSAASSSASSSTRTSGGSAPAPPEQVRIGPHPRGPSGADPLRLGVTSRERQPRPPRELTDTKRRSTSLPRGPEEARVVHF